MSNLEIESALAICASKPELAANEIADLTTIGRYELQPRPEQEIRDFYLDLNDHVLRDLGFGLRMRLVGDLQKITLKGRPQEVSGGGRVREEIEMVWSQDALLSIVSRVADDGLLLVSLDEVVNWREPLTVLGDMGFIAEQIRHTRRRPRDVYLGGDPTSLLAELVVDSVRYRLQVGEVRHHEVEIEVKADAGTAAMQEISAELLARWPEELRVWDFGKRATGRVVETLIVDHGENRIIADTGDILPDAYDLIAAKLR